MYGHGKAGTKLEAGLSSSDADLLRAKGFHIGRQIGAGSYAKVYKAYRIIDETKSKVLACKLIDTVFAPADYRTKFLPRELDALVRLNHPHIVAVCAVFRRRAKNFVFLRYAENGDLLDFLTRNGALPEKQARLWMHQIVSGIRYIHAVGFAHRDLKCENVLVSANYNVKLTDFGFARRAVAEGRALASDTYCGSLSYAAPEVLRGSPYLPRPADMWSVGVIMYTMLNKALPFDETSVRRLHDKQLTRKWRFRTNVVHQLSDECKRLVSWLMEPEPHARPSADACLREQWLAGVAPPGPGAEDDQLLETGGGAPHSARLKARSLDGLNVLKLMSVDHFQSTQLFEI